MKNIILFIISTAILILTGCSRNNNNGSNPVGITPIGGNNNNTTVTFQVSIEKDQQGDHYFVFKPSVSVKITKVEATLNNQPQGTVDGDGTTVYTTAEGFSVKVNAPETGDKWTFTITGKVANTNNSFTSKINYTVPAGFGGNGETVSIEINLQPGQEGSVDFLFKPNVDIKITKVDVEMGGATDVINGDGTTVYSANNWYVLAGYNGVSSGQQWSFTFSGKTAANNTDYNVTVKYTVP